MSGPTPRPGTGWLAWVVMAASGFAGLGYQLVWTQQCALWLGHESAAVLAVVAAFFGGLALGALALGPRIARSTRPGRWYAGCELAIALWGLALVGLMDPTSRALLQLTGAQPSAAWQWAVAFTGCTALLLPATVAMGATLPAMARLTEGLPRQGVAALYAANTAGAVAGVLATAFWLVPAWGLARTAGLCVALNLGCAAAAWWALPRRVAAVTTPGLAHPESGTAGRAALWRLAATGLLGIGYEVGVVRVLSQVAEDTVYTFALLLAVYLVGTALGAAAWQRWAARPAGAADAADAARLTDRLLLTLAGACLLGTASLWAAEDLKQAVLDALGAGMPAALAAEATLALAAFGLPTLVMGALFSQLCAAAAAAGVPFGRALGVNTLGAALAPLAVGVLLAPAVGPKGALLALAAGYVALCSRRCWRTPAPWAGAALVGALAVAAPPLAFIDLPDGGRVLRYEDGAMAAVSVVADADGVARLRINNRQQEGSSHSVLVDGRQALLPLLLHPAPRRALFLGLGTGVTASVAALDPAVQVDVVELLPEVVRASALFAPAVDGGAGHARLNLMAADARRYVRAAGAAYDVIVSDNFHPARSGSGALYTVEHFDAVRQRLAPGGVFCQWLPLHQMDLATLRSVVRAFTAVYPGALAVLASHSLATPVLGLVGRADGRAIGLAALQQRVASSGLAVRFGLDDAWAVLGSVVGGPAALARLGADAPANTDDHPVVAYRAPRVTYAPAEPPAHRLMTLLQLLDAQPAEVLGAGDAAAAGPRLVAYWAARQRFIVAGQAVQPVADVQAMLAQVQAPLLQVLRTSPDFRPAYDPLLRMATALAAQDAPSARGLLAELARLQPARPEALQALRSLDDAPVRR